MSLHLLTEEGVEMHASEYSVARSLAHHYLETEPPRPPTFLVGGDADTCRRVLESARDIVLGTVTPR